jgi:hypothetical protein
MIENVVGQALEGDVNLSFPPKGVRCEIVIPRRSDRAASRRSSAPDRDGPSAACGTTTLSAYAST